MTTLTKLLAATVLSGAALVGSAPAQYLQVRPVPTLTPAPTVLPRPHPNPGPFPPPVIDIDYKVFYRANRWDRWHYYTTAQTRHEARHIERRLEAEGYQVSLVEKLDRTPDR